jgi:hypothetical protein
MQAHVCACASRAPCTSWYPHGACTNCNSTAFTDSLRPLHAHYCQLHEFELSFKPGSYPHGACTNCNSTAFTDSLRPLHAHYCQLHGFELSFKPGSFHISKCITMHRSIGALGPISTTTERTERPTKGNAPRCPPKTWLDLATIRFRVFGPSSFNTALQLVLRLHFLVHFGPEPSSVVLG